MTGVLLREGRFETETGKPGEDRAVAETAVVNYKAGAPRLAHSHRKLGKRREAGSLSGPPESTSSADPLILDFWPPEL